MKGQHSRERVVIVHTAGTAAEAMVIRSLLESAGIRTLESVSSDPFPLNEPHEGFHGAEIRVPESEADEARRVISEHLDASAGKRKE